MSRPVNLSCRGITSGQIVVIVVLAVAVAMATLSTYWWNQRAKAGRQPAGGAVESVEAPPPALPDGRPDGTDGR